MSNEIINNKALELLTEVRVIVGKLQVHIEGNGGKGLLQRQNETDVCLEEVKEWQNKRPKVCPATAKEIIKSLSRGIALATGILAIVAGIMILTSRRIGDSKTEALQQQMKTLQEAIQSLNQ